MGDGYRAKNEELSDAGIPFARAADINEGFHFDNADRFPTENLARVGEKISRSGDVVFTSKGTVGRFAYVTDEIEPFVFSPQLCYWRSLDRSRIEPRYLYYWLSGPEFFAQFMSVKGQTDMADYVSLRDQRRMFLTLPSLDEQRAIADVLGALDDKIELNRRMNETLEETAGAVFVREFNGAAEVAAAEEFDITMGQSPPGETYNEIGDGMAFFQGRADFGFRFPSNRVYCTAPTRRASAGDTLVSVRAPVGDVNMALVDCAIGRGVAAVRHKSGSRSVTYYAMKRLRALFDVFESEGTVFGSISKGDFAKMRVPHLSEGAAQFEELAGPLDRRIELNERESRTLAELRDALLPKLISGELRVRDAEAAVESAGA